MADKITDYKIKTFRTATVEDVELPVLPGWDQIPDRPKTLAQLDPAAAESVATIETSIGDIETEIGSLGDLAYEDLVGTLQLSANAVTNAKIAVDAIQGAVIAAGAITETKISDNSISTAKLQAASITAAKIDAGAITATKIASDAVTSSKIDAGAVTAQAIASGAVTTIKLDAQAVTADKIAANTITASQINVSSIQAAVVTAAAINAVTITSISVTGGTITGALVRTASSGTRVEMSSAQLRFYFSGTLYGEINPFNGGVELDASLVTITNKLAINPSSSRTEELYVQGDSYISGTLEVRDIEFSTGSTTNPNTSGEMRYYDGGSKGFRGYVNGFLGQFDLTAA